MNNGIKTPKISVRIPAYNHEKYIRECLDSVLNQTFQNFEIVITDDGSTDRTADIIREYNDPRIKLVVFENNQGSASAIANALQRASGEYVANICSDDMWELDKLEKQVYFLENNPDIDAVFTRVQLIDEDSNPFVDEKNIYFHVFEEPNRTRDEWLRLFFYGGNCLCIPSVMIKREVYEGLSYQDKRMANLNDFDLWVRFCLNHDLYILEDKLTKFRLRANEANTSGNRIENNIRIRFEYKQILENFLKINYASRLVRIFPECERYGMPEDRYIPFFLGRLAYDTGIDFKQLWGMETIFGLMKDESMVKKLEEKYGFSYNSFYQLTREADVFKLKNNNNLRWLQDEILRLKKVVEDQLLYFRNLEPLEDVISRINKIAEERYQDIKKLESQKEILLNEIERIHNTLSWRITSPFRKAGAFMKKKRL